MSLNAGPGSDIVVSTQRRADLESLFLTARTYAQLKSTPGNATGDIAYCSDCNQGDGLIVVWNGSDWFREVAQGGTIVEGDDGFIYHAFTDPGTFELYEPALIDYLIISGGGAGGASPGLSGGGGGGGGDVKTSQSVILTTGNYPVVSGNGGQRDVSPRKGQTSSFNGQSCEGGGGGPGGPGACGAGVPGPRNYQNTGRGDPGFPGGGRFPPGPGGTGGSGLSGGGGGGLGSAGSPGSGGGTPSQQRKNGGAGGNGISLPNIWSPQQNPNVSSFIPQSQVCAGGGGGGDDGNSQNLASGGQGGSGGAGGRGGGSSNGNAQPGQTNGSGGGGGHGAWNTNMGGGPYGGNGGDGIVVIRYPNPGNVLNI